MAKRIGDTVLGSDKAKVRVFFAEVEGNNDSVQEALRTMVSAMSRQIRVVSDVSNNRLSSTIIPPERSEEINEVFDDTSDIVTEETTTESARTPRGSGKKKDRNSGLNLVPDLNFRPNGHKSLKEFVEQKAPKNDIEAALAMVYFMQHRMSVSRIGSNHVLTAFKEVGKPIPADLRQTIRNVKKSKMWLNFADLDDVRTTTQGDNFVEHEMGKGE